jgi:hypothetical protein
MGQDVYVPPGFGNRTLWSELLDGWLRLATRYENGVGLEQDFSYWYNESPLTGLRAAAVWELKDGWSLQEFRAKRRGLSGKFLGRADLWVGCGASGATVEAKLCWVESSLVDAQRDLRGFLAAARAQLRALTKTNRVGEPFSVCYVVPWYKGEVGKDEGINALTELEKWLRTESMATAIHISDKATKWRKREYPGVLLVARQEQWLTPLESAAFPVA